MRFWCIILAFLLPAAAGSTAWFVDALAGSDFNSGSEEAPFSTIERAVIAARHVQWDSQASTIYLRDSAVHRPLATVHLSPADSGLTLAAMPGEHPVVSGSVRLTNWTLVNSSSSLWMHALPAGIISRQLFVNGARATRIRHTSPLPGRWWFGAPERVFITDNVDLLSWRNANEVEFVFRARGLFTEQRCVLASVSPAPGNDSLVWVEVADPCYFNVQVSSLSCFPEGCTRQDALDTNITVEYIENVFEFLPVAPLGTFYIDRSGGTGSLCARDVPGGCVVYLPRAGEDMMTAIVELPVLERLFDLSSPPAPAAPIADIAFVNLTFEHTTWLLANTPDGYVPQQAGVHLLGSTTFEVTAMPCENLDCEPIPGAMTMRRVRDVSISDCTFRSLGATAVWIAGGSQVRRQPGTFEVTGARA